MKRCGPSNANTELAQQIIGDSYACEAPGHLQYLLIDATASESNLSQSYLGKIGAFSVKPRALTPKY